MKNQITNFLKTDRTFRNGVTLYMTFGKNLSLKKRINVEGNTEFVRNLLFDQLRILAGISDKEYALILKTPVNPVPEVKKVPKAAKIPKAAKAKATSKPVVKTGKSSTNPIKPVPPKK